MDTEKEIKQQMTDKFMNDENVRNLYSITEEDTFAKKFPTGSIESILFYIVAYIIYIREKAHELWQSDVEATALATRYGTKQWWHKMALAWQYGDEIKVTNEGTLEYDAINEDKKLNKYCAVIAEDRTIYVKVAKQQGDDLEPLSADELTAFNEYLDDIKPLGIRTIGQSLPACSVKIDGSVFYDVQKDKTAVSTAVKTAIKTYLNSIVFGGVLFRTKLIDAIQQVDGVTDVQIEDIVGVDADGNQTHIDRTYRADGGYYQLKDENYQLVIEAEDINN